MDRRGLADLLLNRLAPLRESLRAQFETPGRIRSFVVDDLIPGPCASRLYASFPSKEEMILKRSLRESKYVSAQMSRHAPLLEEAVFAFQDERFVALLGHITGIERLLPDSKLYAGGISAMNRGSFLNPHLDNSHSADRSSYRVLNLLWYITPDWKEEFGGNLELWDAGLRAPPRVILSQFNRLVAMQTDRRSLHSVNPIGGGDGRSRCCVSNYYFSTTPLGGNPYFHATSFRGRPGQRTRDTLLRADNALRTAILKFFPRAYRNPHVYVK